MRTTWESPTFSSYHLEGSIKNKCQLFLYIILQVTLFRTHNCSSECNTVIFTSVSGELSGYSTRELVGYTEEGEAFNWMCWCPCFKITAVKLSRSEGQLDIFLGLFTFSGHFPFHIRKWVKRHRVDGVCYDKLCIFNTSKEGRTSHI